MLTIEQKAAVARLQGQEKLISGLLEEVKADLIKAIVNTEPHELKTREENYQQYQLIKKLDNKIYSTIQSYKNTNL